MKIKILLLPLLAALLLVGCKTTTAPPNADVVTTASIVNTEAAFESALGKNGTWIIASLKDMTFDKALLWRGNQNGKKDRCGE